MSWRVQTKDGAIGKSLKTTRTKKEDTETVTCEIKAQAFVSRELFEDLCGRTRGWSTHFYDDLGAPLDAMSLLLIRRELEANGTLSRGEQPHAAQLLIKNATASSLRFRIDNHGAILICTLSWAAAGDEIDDVKPLLGQAVYVNIVFAESKQQRLGLSSGAVVADELAAQRGKKKKKKGGRKRREEQIEILADAPDAQPRGDAPPEPGESRDPDDERDSGADPETRH